MLRFDRKQQNSIKQLSVNKKNQIKKKKRNRKTRETKGRKPPAFDCIEINQYKNFLKKEGRNKSYVLIVDSIATSLSTILLSISQHFSPYFGFSCPLLHFIESFTLPTPQGSIPQVVQYGLELLYCFYDELNLKGRHEDTNSVPGNPRK